MERWRDEKKVPLSELDQAMAVYSADGQVDDASGGEVGAQQTIEQVDREVPAEGDPDPDTEQGRRVRPTPDGHPGPV
ncbi:hypothetical protein [Rugosimonospora africana]|uniref:Uncharacterized protein n=1 Tax=Rugosimonospora africana TaxID=556532 RepID=A0A8J3VP05_9ACTN|nr:hypothetical protein [Rugosimonospora africana]GIH12851.1 hypothetical protein Raf01_10230 [Rugosimonospora africana]